MARLDAARRVIARFHWRQVRSTLHSVPLRDPVSGQMLGMLDLIAVADRKIHIKGWIQAGLIGFATELEHVAWIPDAQRPDHPAQDRQGVTGFELSLDGAQQLVVRVDEYSLEQTVQLQSATRAAWNLARSGMALIGFLSDWRDIWAYFAHGDSEAGNRLEQRLDPINSAETLPTACPGLFDPAPQERALTTSVDIILPVYDAFDDVTVCLNRLAMHTDPRHRIIVINDASPDERIVPLLQGWADTRGNTLLLTNDQNHGFVASVNLGLDIAKGHVVLLNSDAFVVPDWVDRLFQPILRDGQVATVTPMATDSEIFSAPVECARFEPEPGLALHMDAVARRLNIAAAVAEAPTGVGFCMAMNAAFLAKIPKLDTDFGRGYGEEVDWCRKAAGLGARHVGLGSIYIEHRGGSSFGAEKLKRIRENNRTIQARYPGYDELVARFRQNDPMIGPRLAMALASIDHGQNVPVYLSERLGGGSEHWLDRKIAGHVEGAGGAVVLRDDVEDNFVILEVHTALGATRGRIALREMADYLSVLRNRNLIYSCLVRAGDPLGLIEAACAALTETDHLEVCFHDYFPLCPSYNLISAERRFCELPDVAECQSCYARLAATSGQRPPTIAQWRERWNRVLDRANSILVFSENSRDLVCRVWPEVAAKTDVMPHQLSVRPPPVPMPVHRKTVMGVLGAIGYSKGASVLRDLSALTHDAFEIVVIGKLDPAYASKKIKIHGNYSPEDISELAKLYGITGWFVPSVWPETFCYAAHECIATGLPVMSFDLGAHGAAIADYRRGKVVALDCSAKELRSEFLKLVSNENRGS
ncbi:MAG: glycosyltransferase [Marinosulfonomonas sp.]|nr:glycosyltransferase [Marinosulfonomonas sp.]